MLSNLFSRFMALEASSPRHDSIVNTASGLGTAEDASIHARPTFEGRLSATELEALYLQSDLARRIIEELVDDTIRQGWEVFDASTFNP